MLSLTTFQKFPVIFLLWLFLVLLAFRPLASAEQANAKGLCFDGKNETVPPPTHGPEATLVITEGNSKSYKIKLCSAPTGDVTVAMQIRNAQNQVSIDAFDYAPKALIFKSSNYSISRTVMVTVVQDTVQEPASVTFKLYHQATSALDQGYTWSFDKGPWVQIDVKDNDTPANTTKIVYLPLIARSSPAQWQKFVNTNSMVLGVVDVADNKLFVGERSDQGAQGLYHFSGCATNATTVKDLSDVIVLDLFMDGDKALLGSFGKKAYYGNSPFANSNWQQSGSNMNAFVYGVARDKNGASYAGADDGLYQSSDNGATFTKIGAPGNPALINAIRYFSSLDGDGIWIATNNAGVIRYSISSNIFQPLNANLPGNARQIWDIVMRSPSEVYIATPAGVFKGEGSPISAWSRFRDYARNTRSLELVGNTLYIGTTSESIWSCDLAGSAPCGQQTTALSGSLIRDLYYDDSGLCKNVAENRNGLLAATDKGLWVYR